MSASRGFGKCLCDEEGQYYLMAMKNLGDQLAGLGPKDSLPRKLFGDPAACAGDRPPPLAHRDHVLAPTPPHDGAAARAANFDVGSEVGCANATAKWAVPSCLGHRPCF